MECALAIVVPRFVGIGLEGKMRNGLCYKCEFEAGGGIAFDIVSRRVRESLRWFDGAMVEACVGDRLEDIRGIAKSV